MTLPSISLRHGSKLLFFRLFSTLCVIYCLKIAPHYSNRFVLMCPSHLLEVPSFWGESRKKIFSQCTFNIVRVTLSKHTKLTHPHLVASHDFPRPNTFEACRCLGVGSAFGAMSSSEPLELAQLRACKDTAAECFGIFMRRAERVG